MANQVVEWPKKKREVRLAQMDLRIWNDFTFRNDDIIIATYAKAGTTWTQQIVAELVLGDRVAVGPADSGLAAGKTGQSEAHLAPVAGGQQKAHLAPVAGGQQKAHQEIPIDVQRLSPWVDLRTEPFPHRLARLEAQTHRRFLKTHLPADALVISRQAKYIYVARDGRDVVWSMHNHHRQLKDDVYDIFNHDLEPGIAPFRRFDPASDGDLPAYFRRWMDQDGLPWWPFWESIRSWWAIRHLPNVHMIHFADLKRDLPGEIGRIAAFLGVPIDEARLRRTAERCSFEYMRANAAHFAPRGGATLKDGAQAFLHRGTNGRWREMLTSADIDRYEAQALAELGAPCARWLAAGRARSE